MKRLLLATVSAALLSAAACSPAEKAAPAVKEVPASVSRPEGETQALQGVARKWEEALPGWKWQGWLPDDEVLDRESRRLRAKRPRTPEEQRRLQTIDDEINNRLR